ncbi:type VII secretion protein EccB [Catenuloplanes nepalensis]|uniref:Type VII secretion protein EccB n=1 Tax=Catenuloplanes nepalensis TaxID=587533 RepID=A0ABT9MMP9_9ACTN|nr:type VII secretion protein EccB [Catenuloplanes nepalensis]MDP9792684.1 type VII secretion protein EccB [Catenuloplanes nepalensis]
MQNRRDQAQAQSYLMGRLSSALVSAEPDGLETPHRRTSAGLLLGLLVAALVAGGFTLYGFLVPGGSTRWRTPGTLVVEKETGTRYLYVQGRLHPVLNLASARLLLGAPPQPMSVSGKSLRGVPHGQPIGIAGAPDTLPAAGFGGSRWNVCAVTARDLAGGDRTATALAVTTAPTGAPPADGTAIVAQVAGAADRYLIRAGHRHRITGTWISTVLGYETAPLAVPAAWLDLIPAGPDLAPVDVPGRGEPGPRLDGRDTRVGQIFNVGTRHYLLRRDGLARLTGTGAALLLGDPATAAAYGGVPVAAVPLGPAALATAALATTPALPDGLPAEPPEVAGGGNWCVTTSAGAAPEITAQDPPGALEVVRDGLGVTRSARTADAIAIEPGLGGLVRGGRPGEIASGTYYLVTDAGVKYPLADAAAATTLGYDATAPAVVDPALLGLLPTGPVLGAAQARGGA